MIIAKSKQSGFGTIEGLLVVIILLLIGFAGWYIWDKNQHPSISTVTNSSTNSNTAASYLEIKELGIKLKLTDNTKDLAYAVNSQGKIVLSSKSLAAEEPKCAADYEGSVPGRTVNGVGSVEFYADPEAKDLSPGGDLKNSELSLDPLQVGSKYFYLWSHQSFCVNAGTHNKPEDKAYQLEDVLVGAIRRHEIKIEKL